MTRVNRVQANRPEMPSIAFRLYCAVLCACELSFSPAARSSAYTKSAIATFFGSTSVVKGLKSFVNADKEPKMVSWIRSMQRWNLVQHGSQHE